MGDFKEHVLFGLLTAAVLSYFVKELMSLTSIEVFLGAMAVFLGSIIPDVDHKRSYIHRSVKSFTSIAAGVFAAFMVPLDIQFRYLAALTVFLTVYTGFSAVRIKHRGFTHSLTFCILVTSTAVVLSSVFLYTLIPGIALGIGLLSHLLLDRELKL